MTERSLALLRERLDAVPDALAEVLAAPPSLRPQLDVGRVTVVTGAGGSEGPARMLALLLAARGVPIRYEPPSSFVLDGAVRAETCVVFSHGLSPTARLVLASCSRMHRVVVVGATEPPAGVDWLRHGPAHENGLLLRLVGPSVATLLCCLLAGAAAEHANGLCDAVRAAGERARALIEQEPLAEVAARARRLVLLTVGVDSAWAFGARHKLMEGAGIDAAVHDILQLAHGPFQQLFDDRVLVVCLCGPAERDQELVSRLRQMLQPARHACVAFTADLPPPLGWFEHDAQIGELCHALLRRRPRDLAEWPGKGLDRPLYDLAEPLGQSTGHARGNDRQDVG